MGGIVVYFLCVSRGWEGAPGAATGARAAGHLSTTPGPARSYTEYNREYNNLSGPPAFYFPRLSKRYPNLLLVSQLEKPNTYLLYLTEWLLCSISSNMLCLSFFLYQGLIIFNRSFSLLSLSNNVRFKLILWCHKRVFPSPKSLTT